MVPAVPSLAGHRIFCYLVMGGAWQEASGYLCKLQNPGCSTAGQEPWRQKVLALNPFPSNASTWALGHALWVPWDGASVLPGAPVLPGTVLSQFQRVSLPLETEPSSAVLLNFFLLPN